jgi:PAS domain S-box-containing protein
MLDPVAYLSTDGTIEKYNRAFASFLDKDIKSIKGLKCHEVLHHSPNHIDACPLTHALESKKRETADIGFNGRDLIISVDPVFAPDGNIRAFVHIMRDVTEMKKAQTALEESKLLYQLVAETAYDFIITTDLDHHITFANKAVYEFLEGMDPLGLRIDAVTPPAYRARQDEFLRLRRQGVTDIFSYEWEVNAPSGKTVILDVRSQLLTQNQQPAGVLFVARDITERKKAEEERIKLEKQLYDAQKMEAVGTLASGIAHDFNNILAVIMEYAELLRDNRSLPAHEDNLQRLLMAAERARELVQQILTFSRHADHDKKPVDLKLIIREEIRLLRATMPKSIDIRHNIAGQPATVIADVTQIHQIIMNLCTNAAQAMGEKGGILSITLARENLMDAETAGALHLKPGAYVKVSVTDTGPGIDTKIANRIFEPFFTTKKPGEGTGLGLSVVYGIVKNHDGAILVESPPGAGAAFHIYLPLANEPAVGPGHPSESGLSSGKEHILFIDDEADITRLAEASLKRLGYHVTISTDSREALAMFKSRPEAFDLVITDMTMPHLSGSDLAREILQVRPAQPIILCTGYSSYIDAEKAAQMGIKSFLLKPLSRKALAEAVRKILDEQANAESSR